MYKVLVIDDKDFISQLLREILTKFEFSVETATGGREGLQLFENQVFDLVITDIRMPDIDGYGVAKPIRGSDKHKTPLIAISGTEIPQRGGPFDAHLAKPFSIQNLLETIHRILPNHAYSQEKYLNRALQ